ncbi:hypothetical protein BFN03_18795 [Rhodococcus sp. WMMA185]|nr:hypothetical protein BFN03_18795 [Rhodococcus sp. WMMA185]
MRGVPVEGRDGAAAGPNVAAGPGGGHHLRSGARPGALQSGGLRGVHRSGGPRGAHRSGGLRDGVEGDREDDRPPERVGTARAGAGARPQAVRRGVVDRRGVLVAGGHSVASDRSVDHPGRCCGGNSRTNLQWLGT